MPNWRVFEVSKQRDGFTAYRRFQRDLFQELPDVPVLPETLLLMDLRAHERQVNLREVSQLVLSDLGAALQIFRAAGDGNLDPEDRPRRIEDCISLLGMDGCLETMSSRTVRRGLHKGAVLESWTHARKIATYCGLMAEDFAAGVAPDQAYLVGLFHELGSLPRVLGWNQAVVDASDMASAGLRIAEEWALPRCVREYFCELQVPSRMNRWSTLLHTAHELASMPQIESCFSAGISVQAPACA